MEELRHPALRVGRCECARETPALGKLKDGPKAHNSICYSSQLPAFCPATASCCALFNKSPRTHCHQIRSTYNLSYSSSSLYPIPMTVINYSCDRPYPRLPTVHTTDEVLMKSWPPLTCPASPTLLVANSSNSLPFTEESFPFLQQTMIPVSSELFLYRVPHPHPHPSFGDPH